MRSMTGYGRGEYSIDQRRFIVEIKAVNHRYNDINIKLPRAMFSYEDKIKKLLLTQILRGKVDVYINFETFSKEDIQVKYNETLANGYADVLNAIRDRFCPEDKVSVSLLAKLPDVISVENSIDTESEDSTVFKGLYTAAENALQKFVEMRTTEGENLKANILDKLTGILNIVKVIEKRAPLVAADYKTRLINKLNELEEIKADEARILTEVTVFADKACIDEEITRLFSHIEQMKNILNETVPVGRKLDFLVQEMNREVNTIGSKSNDIEITSLIVEAKSEIEKIREQVQNIE